LAKARPRLSHFRAWSGPRRRRGFIVGSASSVRLPACREVPEAEMRFRVAGRRRRLLRTRRRLVPARPTLQGDGAVVVETSRAPGFRASARSAPPTLLRAAQFHSAVPQFDRKSASRGANARLRANAPPGRHCRRRAIPVRLASRRMPGANGRAADSASESRHQRAAPASSPGRRPTPARRRDDQPRRRGAAPPIPPPSTPARSSPISGR
jgi:hypothetical protein